MIFRLILGCFLFISMQVSAQLIKIPGTSVSMIPPEGFTLSQDFTGFENVKTKSSIMIVEFPQQSYGELAELFLDLNLAREHLSPQGVSFIDRKDISLNNSESPALFLSGVQTYEGFEIGKHLSLVEGDLTVLISYNIFDKEQLTTSSVINSVKSISLGEEAPLSDQLDILTFEFSESDDFNIINVLGGSSVILASFLGEDETGIKPIIAVESSILSAKVTDKVVTSKQLILTVSGFEKATINNIQYQEFAGSQGIRIEANSGLHTVIQYTGFFDNGAYIRLIATGGHEEIKDAANSIEVLVDSVKLK